MTSKNGVDFGVLFGFVGIFIVFLGAYSLVWHMNTKREERKEAARKAALVERGFGPLDEKDLNINGRKGKNSQGAEYSQGLGQHGQASTFGSGSGTG